MPNVDRDPYASERAPKSKSGPLMRYAIVGGLLAAAAVGYATMSDGPGLTEPEAVAEQTTTLADTSQDRGYAVAPAEEFAVPEAPAAAPSPAPARRVAPTPRPAPEAEALPPPTTTTTEPTAPATPLPPSF